MSFKYYKIIEEDTVVAFGYCGKYPPVDSIIITEDEYNNLVEEYETNAPQAEPENPYGIDDETYNNIIDDYTASLTKEVAQNGYN